VALRSDVGHLARTAWTTMDVGPMRSIGAYRTHIISPSAAPDEHGCAHRLRRRRGGIAGRRRRAEPARLPWWPMSVIGWAPHPSRTTHHERYASRRS